MFNQDNDKLFDFMTAAGQQGWEATHDLAPLSRSSEGMVLRATGGDPYAIGGDDTDGKTAMARRPIEGVAIRDGADFLFSRRRRGD